MHVRGISGIIGWAICFPAACSCLADFEWRGTIVRGGGPTFALMDTESGTSKWVPLGGTFETYVVSSYDAQRQVLVLVRDDQRMELTLASPKPALPPAEEQQNLSGMALAQSLADKGDAQLKDLLVEHRNALLRAEQLSREVLELERSTNTPPAIPGQKSVQQVHPDVASARAALDVASRRAATLGTQIEELAAEKNSRGR